MDLFEYARELNKDKESPLAGRMRPATLDEVVGQEHRKDNLSKSHCQYDQSKFCTDECNNIWEERYAGSGGRCERISWNVSEEDDLVY